MYIESSQNKIIKEINSLEFILGSFILYNTRECISEIQSTIVIITVVTVWGELFNCVFVQALF